jgi:signal transduction histidine kinase
MRAPLSNAMGILQTTGVRFNNNSNSLSASEFEKFYEELNTSLSFLELLINDILDINRIAKGTFFVD